MDSDMMKKTGYVNRNLVAGVLIAGAIAIGIAAMVLQDTTGKRGSGLGKEFEYDVAELMKIDPELILYKEIGGSLETGFKSAKAMAIGDDGKIYVVGDKALRVWNGNQMQFQVGLSAEPSCIALGQGKIYIGMGDHVEVYDRFGGKVDKWQSSGKRAVLTSIAMGKGNVFVADAGNRIVYRFDMDGKLLNRIGEKNSDRNIDGFLIPSPYFDLAMGGDGLLRVVNPGRHRIEAYTFDGDLEFSWGAASNSRLDGFCGCCNPINIAILPNGNFVTCEKGLTRVKEYDGEGKFLGVVAGPAQLSKSCSPKICNVPKDCQQGGFDIAVDGDGRVFVLDTRQNLVRIFIKSK